MYYHIVGESQNSYARYVFLNELLSNQDLQYIDDLINREKEEPLRFNQAHCYLCLLGLKKKIYSGHYGMGANEYMEIYVRFERRLMAYFEKNGYQGEITLHLYGGKQIILIYSPVGDCDVLPDQVAQYAQDCLQLMYQEVFLKDGHFCNQTYFIPEAINCRQLAKGLEELIKLSELHFFLMKPIVLTPQKIEEEKKIPLESDLQELRYQIFSAINQGDALWTKDLLEDLMLNKIKYGFSCYQLQDTLGLLKRYYLQSCSAYDIPLEKDVARCFDYRQYPTIEALTNKLISLFANVIEYINQRAEKYSRLTQEALKIIKTNYFKPEISLSYVASRINVNSSYLSSIFNREVGMNMTKYIAELRIERAKTLLEETDLSLPEIALKVGYHNKRYFTDMFKKRNNCTPSEYRTRLKLKE